MHRTSTARTVSVGRFGSGMGLSRGATVSVIRGRLLYCIMHTGLNTLLMQMFCLYDS